MSLATRRLGFQIRNLQTLKAAAGVLLPNLGFRHTDHEFRHSRVQSWTITVNLRLDHGSLLSHTAVASVRSFICSQPSFCYWCIQLTHELVLLNPSSPAVLECIEAQTYSKSWAKRKRHGSLQRSNACSSLRHLNRECYYSCVGDRNTSCIQTHQALTFRLKKKPEDKRKQEGAVRHM